MSPAKPSAQASSTRVAQRARAPRRMKSSSMRCITSLLRGERKLAVGERFGAPGVVHFDIELALRADDHPGDGLREPEEGAFALEDLGQHVAPAAVHAAAADGDPHAALDKRERQASGL